MTDPNDGARMAAGIRAIRAYEARLRQHDEIGNGAPPPLEITDRPGYADRRLAETVRCRFCKALPGTACHLASGAPMRLSPCHPERLEDAKARLTEGEPS